MMTNTFAEQAQRARDLRAQLTEIGAGDRGDQEMQFIEWSPGRKLVKLWSMHDGQEITIPQYMVMGAITKRLPDGRFAFTAHQNEAPAFKDGEISCFLAANSPERDSGLLEAAGLSHLPPCPAEHLRSNYSKRIHAFNRHRQAWESLQDHVATQEREMERGERRQQTDAMLQMAGNGRVAVREALQDPPHTSGSQAFPREQIRDSPRDIGGSHDRHKGKN